MFICASAFWFSSSTAAEISLTDDLGRKVELKRPAQRIVTLAPFLTELAFSAGAGDRVVAVSAHSDYPPAARDLPQVASAAGFSLEEVISLGPDLVLAWSDAIREEDLERLNHFGVPVYVARAKRLDDAARLLEAIGTLTGRDTRAAARTYRQRLATLRTTHVAMQPMPVFLEIWHRPLQTIAGTHWMNEALALCGAVNVFEDLPGVAPLVSWEALYARDPRAIVGAGSAGSKRDFLANWKTRATLSAVKAGRQVFVDPDRFQRPTLRLAEGVQQLCDGLDRVR